MRTYLPLVFELLIAGAVIAWGVRELMLLNRDERESRTGNEDKDG